MKRLGTLSISYDNGNPAFRTPTHRDLEQQFLVHFDSILHQKNHDFALVDCLGINDRRDEHLVVRVAPDVAFSSMVYQVIEHQI